MKLTREKLFLILYGIYVYVCVINLSNIDAYILDWVVMPAALVLLLILYIFQKDFRISRTCIDIVIFLVFFYAGIVTSSKELAFSAGFLICAHMTDFRKIVKTSMIVNILGILSVLITFLFDYTRDNVVYRYGKAVHSYGFSYYTMIPFILYYIIVMYLYLRKKLQAIELLILAGIIFIIYYIWTNRLTFVLGIAVLVLYLFFINISKANINKKFFRYIGIIIFPVMAYVINSVYFYYDSKDGFWRGVDLLLSSRLTLGHQAFKMYPIQLFGQYLYQNNTGGYFYVDSGFVYALLGCGIIFFVLIVLMYSLVLHHAIINNDKVLFIWIISILVFTFVNNTWFELSYNPVLMYAVVLLKSKHIYGRKRKIRRNHKVMRYEREEH